VLAANAASGEEKLADENPAGVMAKSVTKMFFSR